ncbi:MAG TPA: hypothetical protein VJ841_03600 [Candidatus Saccharimonadales bacterium]|nr:hypothetical protein [Candidatus Saccharimonadales bacterium]
MRSTERTTSKRGGTQLTTSDIDAAKAVGKYRRDEEFKDAINNVKIFAVYATLIALPLLYICLVGVNWNNYTVRDEWLQKGMVAIIAFVLGKIDFSFGVNKESNE